MAVERVCLACGGEFETHRGSAIPGHARYCSMPCAFAHRVASEEVSGGCRVWMGRRDRKNYGLFYWGGKRFGAHRAAWVIAYGEIPEGLCVCHRCDNPPCVRLDHLFLGTVKENTRDACEKGRMHYGDSHGLRKHPERAARGERHGSAKLTATDVADMRRLAAEGSVTQREIAKRFGVTFQTVSQIIARKAWKHVPEQSDVDPTPSRAYRDWGAAE